jgi:hypothetical protein
MIVAEAKPAAKTLLAHAQTINMPTRYYSRFLHRFLTDADNFPLFFNKYGMLLGRGAITSGGRFGSCYT